MQEVNRPPRKGERRLSGKSDTIDAEHAARQVLTGARLATPKTADGSIESLRLLKVARDTAVKARTAAMITLKATLVTAADDLRAELEPLTDHKLIQACAALDSAADPVDPDAAMRHVLSSLARRWLQLHEEIKAHSRHLKKQTTAVAPRLIEAVGIGLDIAAEMLVTAGDNTDRVRSEAAFAKMCGACPIPAGSGRTNGRHRLYRGGNRQANAALYRAVIVRMRWHPANDRLRHPSHRRGPLQARDHPLSQALPGPRDLPPPPGSCSAAATGAGGDTSPASRLTDIGASTPKPRA